MGWEPVVRVGAHHGVKGVTCLKRGAEAVSTCREVDAEPQKPQRLTLVLRTVSA
jgi:hypothetical protein